MSPRARSPALGALLEREPQLRVVATLVRQIQRGRGGTVVFEGPAGIGKTALLTRARSRVRGEDVTLLSATPIELERSFPFGLARRLLGGADIVSDVSFGPVAAGRQVLGALDSDGTPAPGLQAAFNGLFWMLADRAHDKPVLIVVDDVQWADEASLAWFRYLAQRIAELPVGVVVATRPVPLDHPGQLSALCAQDTVAVHGIPALSSDSIRNLIAHIAGAELADSRAVTATEVTGGNPFLLTELLRAWVASDGEAGPLTTRRLQRAASLHVARLGPDATRLCNALVVLGGSAVEIRQAATLAGLDVPAATEAAHALVAAEIVAGGQTLTFTHDLVREALAESLGPARLAEMHGDAARMLDQAGEPLEMVAGHLLVTLPQADPWIVERLRTAAARAARRSAHRESVILLRRASEEPPLQADRAAVLAELGRAEGLAGEPEAEAHLRAALAVSVGAFAAEVALMLARLLLRNGRGREAQLLLDDAGAILGDERTELRLRIEAESLAAVRAQPGAPPAPLHPLDDLRPELTGDTPAERLLLASLTFEATCAGLESSRVDSLAQRALDDGRLIVDEGPEAMIVYFAIASLGYRDQYARALAHLDAALDAARRMGSVAGYALARSWRADVLQRAGSLAEAAADASDALALAGEHELGVVPPLALFPLILVWVDRGRLHEADELLDRHQLTGPLPPVGLFSGVQHARGRLRLAQGRTSEAAADFLAAGEMLLAGRVTSPAVLPWRSDAALAMAVDGDTNRARQLVEAEVVAARTIGSPRAVGLALRAEGLLGPAEHRVRGLTAAADALRTARSWVELARANLDLGIAALRIGRRDDARVTLLEALELAERHGADALAERCETELTVAGGSSRRRRIRGRDALTTAELRVARLAAAGRTNRTIAAELFLTVKTVETHLSHTYTKLGITGRGELDTALARLPEPTA